MSSRTDMFLVGSVAVPGDTAEEAMRICAKTAGDRLPSIPDGEPGIRLQWVGMLGETTYSHHPDLELLQGASTAASSSAAPRESYRVKRGVDDLSFDGYLPYAGAAISSYAVYRQLQDEGLLAPAVRFQVDFPTPHVAAWCWFPETASWPLVEDAWLRAVRSEIDQILAVVPAHELVVQWDYCSEVTDTVGSFTGRREMAALGPWTPVGSGEEKLAQHTSPEYIAPLGEAIPSEVGLGYHFCLGTAPQFPTTPVDDIGIVVRMANTVVSNTPRRVDHVHLPVVQAAGQEYFQPLTNLDVGDALTILGIGGRDGRDAIVKRGRAAQEFLPEFAISHYCGYGRDDRNRVPALLEDLKAAADVLATVPEGSAV